MKRANRHEWPAGRLGASLWGKGACLVAAALLAPRELAAVIGPGRASMPSASRLALPLVFEENQGALDPQVRFVAHGLPAGIFFLRDSVVIDVPLTEDGVGGRTRREEARPPLLPGAQRSAAVRLAFARPPSAVEPVGEDLQVTKVSRFHGSDSRRWVAAAPTYGRVRYRDVLPGIDVVFCSVGEGLEFDLEVAPNADPGAVAFDVEGAASLRRAPDGAIVVGLPGGGELRLRAPVSYQDDRFGRHEVASAWRLERQDRVAFQLSAYRRELPLVIDPILVFSTYLGGSDWDYLLGARLDASGNPIFVGTTYSADFPHFSGLHMASRDSDIAIVKLNAEGSRILFTTTIGGAEFDEGKAIALDAAGNIVVAGYSTFNDYPVVRPVQEFPGGSHDGVVTVLDPTGSSILFSTYLGGWGEDVVESVAVDRHGRIVVGGATISRNFPLTPGAFQTQFRGWDDVGWQFGDGFVAAIDPERSVLEFSTFLGGWDDDRILVVLADDAHDEIVAVGASASPDFPLKDPIQPWLGGDFDTTIVRLSADGKEMRFGTYFGGPGEEFATAALDARGRLVVAGGCFGSSGWPTTPNALQPVPLGGEGEGFLVVMELHPVSVELATFVGGSAIDFVSGVTVDREGMVWLVGATESPDFPALADSPQPRSGWRDAFVVRIDPDEPRFLFSVLLAGSSFDAASAVAVDRFGAAFVAGQTRSIDFPLEAPLQDYWRGDRERGEPDAFIAKISPVAFPRAPRGRLRPASP